MENNNKKWVSLSVLAFAIIVAVLANMGMIRLAGMYDLEAKIKGLEWILRVTTFAIGAGIYALIYLNEKSNAYLNEVVVEVSKIAWPTKDETIKSTIVVVIFVIIAGVILGTFDYLWSLVLKAVL